MRGPPVPGTVDADAVGTRSRPRAVVAVRARLLIALVFTAFVALSCRTTWQMLRSGSWWSDEGVRYRAGTLIFNYVDLGAVRRALGGTIVRLTWREPIGGLAFFHVVSSVFAAAVFCILIARRWRDTAFRWKSIAGVAGLFVLWGADAGRTDVVEAALLGIVALQYRTHLLVAAACLVAALAFHEMGFVFGVPLLAALWAEARLRGVVAGAPWPSRRTVAVAAGLLLAAAACQLLLDRVPHSDPEQIKHWFWSRFPYSEWAEWALYFYVAGRRGVRVAMCQNLTLDPMYVLHLLSGLAVIVATVFVFNDRPRRGWWLPLAAGMLPFLFLSAIAVDLARWSAFGALNAWFVCAARPPGDASRQRSAARLRALVLLALLVSASPRYLVSSGLAIFSPAPLVDRVAWLFTGERRTPSIALGLARCDPAWRDLVRVDIQSPKRP